MTTTKKPPNGKFAPLPLIDAAVELAATYGKPPPAPSHDPLGLVLWEQCAYLADDDTRGAAFRTLEEKTKLVARKVLALPPEELVAIARSGGPIAAEERADRMRAA